LQVEAKVIADSISPDGVRLTTIEGTMHRFVLAEMNKHRMLSQSAQSSRAVPVPKMIEMVRNDPMMPVYWGKNQKGMSANEELSGDELISAQMRWEAAMRDATFHAELLHEDTGAHKQLVNRLLEPFLPQKIVITGTEWENFFRLRCHPDAQPEIRLFAEKIKEAMDNSTPKELDYNEWHLPYVTLEYESAGPGSLLVYVTDSGEKISYPDIEAAKRYSAARCATASYRTEKLTVERAMNIFEQLVMSEPRHSVPLEHVATPMRYAASPLCTHLTKDLTPLSGNFKQWGQMRKEIEGAVL